jgi:endonuclease/exonuclease/phosphatase (EEP) superfamily protein YafD
VIASRYPLDRCGRGRLGPATGADASYLHCVVRVAGLELTVVTVHFASPREGLNAARHEGLDGIDDWRRNYGSRLAQAHALADDMRRAPRPLIVAGDLNAPVSSPVLRSLLDTGLRDAHSSVGRGFGYSYGHDLRPGFSFLRIDHILVSADVGLAGTHVGGRTASEHRPVIADLLLRRPGVSADPAPRPAG